MINVLENVGELLHVVRNVFGGAGIAVIQHSPVDYNDDQVPQSSNLRHKGAQFPPLEQRGAIVLLFGCFELTDHQQEEVKEGGKDAPLRKVPNKVLEVEFSDNQANNLDGEERKQTYPEPNQPLVPEERLNVLPRFVGPYLSVSTVEPSVHFVNIKYKL